MEVQSPPKGSTKVGNRWHTYFVTSYCRTSELFSKIPYGDPINTFPQQPSVFHHCVLCTVVILALYLVYNANLSVQIGDDLFSSIESTPEPCVKYLHRFLFDILISLFYIYDQSNIDTVDKASNNI